MYIGLIAVVIMFALFGLFLALCGVIWVVVNSYRWLDSYLFEDKPFVPFSFDEAMGIFGVDLSTSASSAPPSSYDFRNTGASGPPFWPTPESMDRQSTEHFKRMLPYLHMTHQVDDFMEGGWWNVDLDRNPWEDYDD